MLLAPGQRAAVLAPALLEDREHGKYPLEVLVQLAPATVGAHFQVLDHAQAGEYPPAFGDVPDAEGDHLVRGELVYVPAVEPNCPAGGMDQAGNGAQGRGLPGPIGPEQGHDLAFLHVYIDLAEGGDGAVPDVQV